jgi:ABC-type lipoprotein release transport system permease subunit
VTHALVTSVRRRRRDLAILKTLGFVRSQVSRLFAMKRGELPRNLAV